MPPEGRSSVDSAPLPQQIGAYRIERKLGQGGMGTVYLGKHEDTGKLAAIKVLPASMAREEGFVARFAREIDAMHRVTGENVVEMYDSGEWEGTYYYTMEFVDGETVTDRILREKRLGWREVIEIACQVCKALKAAHNTGIIHRDLKPSNLLLSKEGVCKLTDFGVAHVFAGDQLTATGGVIGTVEYMSPEQAQGRRVDKRSDIYSLGAVMYVMLTGRPPFIGKSALDIAQKHKFGQFDSPRRIVPEIPHWLDEVVCKCLEKNPDNRYPDAYVLQLRLQEIPRKVELTQNSGTFEFEHIDGNEVTLAADGKSSDPEAAGVAMRELMRAHVEHVNEQTLIERILDSTWFLVAALLAIILGGVYWWNHRLPTDEELLAQGQLWMAAEPGPGWERAKREVFDPLVEKDAKRWAPEVEKYLDKIRLYELRKSLLGRRGTWTSRDAETDGERLLRKAVQLRSLGQSAEAKQVLIGLVRLTEGDTDAADLHALANDLLQELNNKTISPERYSLVKRALTRAEELRAGGNADEARALLQTVVDIYASDPDAATFVEQARRGLMP
ncbi:MAG: serine/threonine-protein kinase [Planctomycetaceae bacterium]